MVFLKISQMSQENTCVGVFFIEVLDLKVYDFIKKRLQHSYFPVKFAKFRRTPILKNFCKRLLLFRILRKVTLLKGNFRKVNPIWPGGTNHPPDIKNVITFERLMVLTWNFMTFSKIELALGTWLKKFFCSVFYHVSTFPGRTYFYPKKLLYLVHVPGDVFTY